MALIGRHVEHAVVEQLLATARQGFSATLVVRGEAGIGKTALIDEAVGSATDFLVLRVTGIESEQEVTFGALHRLLRPYLDQIRRLPPRQCDALNAAFGLSDAPSADALLVGLATLSMATNISRGIKRLLCVIDDTQWLDRESLRALAFCGRRIYSDGIAIIFSERGRADHGALDGFTELELTGLDAGSARELLASAAGFSLGPAVSERIIADTRGNPLALVEFAKIVDSNDLIGAIAVQQPLPMSARLEELYARQVRALPEATQRLLLLVAADSTGDPVLVRDAAALIDVTVSDAEAAESEGLVILRPHVDFRHPLIRSAVYGSARPADRRTVHRALADVTDSERDPDRQTWHLAAATIGHDETVAMALERCADRAGNRGGHTVRLAMLRRAAELSPDVDRSSERLVAAADAALLGNMPLQARALLEQAAPHLRSPSVRAISERLDGALLLRLGRHETAAPMLLSAAEALLPFDPALARRTLLEAVEASFIVGGNVTEACRAVTEGVASAALESSGTDQAGDPVIDPLLLAFATLATSGFVAAVPHLRAALLAMTDERVAGERLGRWVIMAALCSRALWDLDLHDALMSKILRSSRERGDLRPLHIALQGSAESALWAARFDEAESFLAQAADIAAAAGSDQIMYDFMQMVVAAWRGQQTDVRTTAAAIVADVEARNSAAIVLSAHTTLVDLEIGLGRYVEALEHAAVVFSADPVARGNLVLPNMIEAASRVGATEQAHRALERLTERAEASGTSWALAVLARSRALVAGDDGESFYQEAIARFETTRLGVELARTHLVYGEWLRRQNRRIDARSQLRVAYEMFATIGTEAFAGRAHAELLATGEHARKRSMETTNLLTSQESHVARLAADGHTNAEIAAEMYIGTNTVDYHLRKVYRKLSVTSRRQLKSALVEH